MKLEQVEQGKSAPDEDFEKSMDDLIEALIREKDESDEELFLAFTCNYDAGCFHEIPGYST